MWVKKASDPLSLKNRPPGHRHRHLLGQLSKKENSNLNFA
jgi:hypothetical protein